MEVSSRRWWRRPGIALTGGVIGSLLLAACGGTPSGTTSGPSILSAYNPEKGTQGGQLVYSDWESVDDLNVLSTSAATTQEVASGPIWAALWVFDAQNKAIPDLVSEIPTTDNGDVKKIDSTHMDVTIKLKKGLKFSDGSPLTSADIKFVVDAICDPDTGAIGTLGYDHITSQETKDDQTLIWHFGPNKSGTCGLSSDLTSGIFSPYLILGPTTVGIPKSVLGNVPHKSFATNDYFTKKPTVTSGPYMVQDFTPGPAAIVTMVPNPNYTAGRTGAKFFGHAPYLNKLTYKIYGDKSSQVAGVKSGDTDLGLDMRCAAENRRAARLMGIDPDRTTMIAWLFAGLLAAMGGVLLASSTNLHPYNLSLQVLPAFVAALIGGLDSVEGAVLGSVVVGLTLGIVPSLGGIGSQGGAPEVALAVVGFIVMALRGRRFSVAGAG